MTKSKWQQDGKIGGGYPTHDRIGADWWAWVEETEPDPVKGVRTHLLLQFSRNAGIDTQEKAQALVERVLAGLNGSPSA